MRASTREVDKLITKSFSIGVVVIKIYEIFHFGCVQFWNFQRERELQARISKCLMFVSVAFFADARDGVYNSRNAGP